ncbi:MAG: hypothetical protein QW156_04525 [Candidatus Aenigmatarchaeota archaeon]
MKFLKKKNVKGSVSFFLVFIFLAILLVFLFGVGIPFLMDIYVRFYGAGEEMLKNVDLTQINDTQIQNELNETFTQAKQSFPQIIDYLGFLFRYSWLIILIVILIIIFLRSRMLVEADVI